MRAQGIGVSTLKQRLLATALLATLPLAACAEPAPPLPSGDPVVPSASPTGSPGAPRPGPTAEPSQPVVPPPPKTPQPTLSEGERYLLAGILRNATDCAPVRTDLPPRSGAGIECASDDPAVARIGFYYFDRDEDLLAAYAARMIREGVAMDSGPVCDERESEGPYVPWDGPDMAPLRYGCFVNDEGYANLRITTGSAVYIGILGRTGDLDALQEFAFRGSHDTPSFPTLWGLP